MVEIHSRVCVKISFKNFHYSLLLFFIRVIYVKVYNVVMTLQCMFFILFALFLICLYLCQSLCLFERSAFLRNLFRIGINLRSTESNQGFYFGLIVIVFPVYIP